MGSRELHELLGRLAPGQRPLQRDPALHEDESRWFVDGLHAGVWEFETCDESCPRRRKWGVAAGDHFRTPSGAARHLFSNPTADEAWLNREYVPHLAAYARAILDFGWDRSTSTFSFYRKFSRDLLTKKKGGGFETDAEFFVDRQLILQIEAKADPAQTRRLADAVRSHSLSELGDAHAKEIEYVLDLQPRYLWIAGPGTIEPATDVFEVTVDGLEARFRSADGLPMP